MKKFTLLIGFFAVFLIFVVAKTASGTTLLTKAPTTTATVLLTSNPALMACCATTTEIAAEMNVSVKFTEKEVAEKRSDLVYGLAKKKVNEISATNLTAGQKNASDFMAYTEARAMWVSNSSALTNNTLTIAITYTGKTEDAAMISTTT
ncbi:MAG: hypothetical protein WCW65_00100 [Candidatus Paceibacterota bacterium]